MQGFIKNDPSDAADLSAALVDFGFYHDLSTVMRMYAEYVNHGNYGYSGGVIDQPDEYWSDITTMRLLHRWVEATAGKPQLEQTSVFDTLRNEGRLMGRFNG
jgi:hypothetical protein